jgi:hypothetical protein
VIRVTYPVWSSQLKQIYKINALTIGNIFLHFFSNGSTAPWGPRPPHFSRLHDHTHFFRHTKLGRTPLDEGPARRRDR